MSVLTGEMLGLEIRDTMVEDMRLRVSALRNEGVVTGVTLLSANPEHTPSARYVRLKRQKAGDVGIAPSEVSTYTADELPDWINRANEAQNTYGIVVQLPLRPDQVDQQSDILNMIAPEKDVDALREVGEHQFAPATPSAIVRLLEGHGVDLGSGPVAINGLGKLVGRPLFGLLQGRGADVVGIDEHTPEDEKRDALNHAAVIITAAGVPNLLTPDTFGSMQPKVLVDAGTAEKGGVIHGDVSDELREEALRAGWLVSGKKNGVGPLTVASLLSNVVLSAERANGLV